MSQSMHSKDPLTRGTIVFALALIACLLWGSAFSMIKLGYRFLSIGGTADQILFAGLRFTLAGILTVVIGKGIFKGSFLPKRSALPCMAWLALFQTILQYTLFYVSLAHLSGVRGSIINGTGTFWAILVACLIFKQEQLTARKLAGCAIGFLGILLVNLSGLHAGASFSVLGDGFMILSTIASSVSAALLRQFGSREAPYLLSGWQFFFRRFNFDGGWMDCRRPIRCGHDAGNWHFDLSGTGFRCGLRALGPAFGAQPRLESADLFLRDACGRGISVGVAARRKESGARLAGAFGADLCLAGHLHCQSAVQNQTSLR